MSSSFVTPIDCSLQGSSVHGISQATNTGVGYHFLLQGVFPTQELNPCLLLGRWIPYHWATWEALHYNVCAKSLQSYPTLCHPMDCNLPGSSVHGILQARIPEWIAMPFSRGSSWSRDRTWVSRIASRVFTIWATKECSLGSTKCTAAFYWKDESQFYHLLTS